MSVQIIIQGTPIAFPTSADSPDWAPAITQFAEAVALALEEVVGTFDVPPQVLNIDAQNPGTNVNLTNLVFPTTDVRGAFIQYTIYRQTSLAAAAEVGTLQVIYNTMSGTWELSREYTGDGQATFNITGTGQIQISTILMAGINHTGRVTYLAKALSES